MSRTELVLNGMEVENPNGPIIKTTYVFNGFLTKEDFEGTKFEGRQILYQYSPYDNRPETVIITESIKPVIKISVVDNIPDAE